MNTTNDSGQPQWENAVLPAEERLAYALREVRHLAMERDEALRRIECLEKLLDAAEILASVASSSNPETLRLVQAGISAMVQQEAVATAVRAANGTD